MCRLMDSDKIDKLNFLMPIKKVYDMYQLNILWKWG